MRLPLVVCALLLAGCAQPGPESPPRSSPAPVPPSLLVHSTPQGTLQVYVHAKHGNVRYDFLNLTAEPLAEGARVAVERTRAYALDLDLGLARANLTVEAVEGTMRLQWQGVLALNATASPPRAAVQPWDAQEGLGEARNVTLPWETLLRFAPAEVAP